MKTKTKRTTKSKTTTKPTLVAFLLDRSGSMETCRAETISGFNGYLDELNKKKNTLRFTLTQFDSISVDLLYDAVLLKDVDKLTTKTYVPRGNTPLYDAMGVTIRATEKKAGEKYDVLFVVLTDGLENASSDWDQAKINQLIKDKEKETWTFAYIGVGPHGWAASNTISAGTISAHNVMRSSADPKARKRDFTNFAKVTACYTGMKRSAGGQSVGCIWTPDESGED